MTPERKRKIELLARDVLNKYDIDENPGRYLNKILDGEGITLIDIQDWPAEICGKFLTIDENPVIYYNAYHTEQMQAFTIAHELGHYFLGHLEDAEPEIICLDREFELMDGNDSEKARREAEANCFAVNLLLPVHLIKPVFASFLDKNGRTGRLYVDKQKCNFSDYKKCIGKMQFYFLASETAIRYRLVDLGWMIFNIEFSPTVDRGTSIARYLDQLNRRYW